MAIYYAAVEGDPLDSGEGGYIYGTKKTIGTIEDKNGKPRNMVFIGDEGYCAKCGSTGSITYGAGVSGRRRMVDLVNGGRLQAVGGDIVLCNCSEPPRIIAVHGQRWMIQDDGGARAATGAQTASASNASSASCDELEHYFEIVDAATEAPIEDMTYKLLSDGASIVDNESLIAGKTMALSKNDYPNLLFIAWRKGSVR